MSLSKPSDYIRFAYNDIEKSYDELSEDSWLKKSIKRAIENIRENVFCGEPIKKSQIPKKYIKEHSIDNLWWYPLPNGWRLVYSIISVDRIKILALIVEFFDHKDYERRFGYS